MIEDTVARGPARGRLSEWRQFARFAWSTLIAPWPPFAVFLAIGGVVAAVTPLVLIYATTGLIDSMSADLLLQPEAVEQSLIESLTPYVPWLLLLIGSRIVNWLVYMDSYQQYLTAQLMERVTERLDRMLFEKSLSLRLELFESPEYYDTLQRAREAIADGSMAENLPHIQRLVTMTLGISAMLYALSTAHWLIPLVLLATSVYTIRRDMQVEQAFIEIVIRQTTLRRRREYWRRMLTERGPAAEIRLFGLGQHFVALWRRHTDRILKEIEAGFRRIAVRLELMPELVTVALSGFTVLVLILVASRGEISVGALVALIYITEAYLTHLGNMGWRVRDLQEFFARFQHVQGFLGLSGEERTDGVAAPARMREGIRFEEVSFVYPGSDTPALSHINLHVRPGERIALVGENGAGKSTMTKLLLGLYRPTDGRITVDGTDLQDIAPQAWRAKVAAVFQDPMRYALTVQENIGFGMLEKLPDLNAINAAADASSATSLIEALPSRYQTLLGKEFESGHDLSLGEWQKLAIARVYLRDADVLVLDEPTSALDALAEMEVYRQFLSLSGGKTVLLVSHRLGSARLTDRILFLRQGSVAEDGTHDELIASGGGYSELYETQAEWYR